ncbi:MAG TPA: phage protein GemA/Gp16 family protein [Longimicrobium sp.]|jgi:hypothetical protein|uniref:phage protein GemA/Gp16 family protein n=1 Tax=Longimicrobium sp. TaxID=2029185 RepID=UPI002ED9FB8F
MFAAAGEVGIGEPGLRDIVEHVSGQRSTRRLDRNQAQAVLDALVLLGARSGRGSAGKSSGKRRVAGVTAMISPGHRQLIDELRREIGGDFVRDAYFAGVCNRVIRKPAPLTASDATRVVEALKKRRDWGLKGGSG